jgi:hypothetical protein
MKLSFIVTTTSWDIRKAIHQVVYRTKLTKVIQIFSMFVLMEHASSKTSILMLYTTPLHQHQPKFHFREELCQLLSMPGGCELRIIRLVQTLFIRQHFVPISPAPYLLFKILFCESLVYPIPA